MDETERLAERFEAYRPHLRAVAYRMLGSLSEAEDAVQESWFRLSRSDVSAVENLGGWLTTVVARVCLDLLRSRESRREDLLGERPPPVHHGAAESADPEQEAVLVDSVGPALLVVLDTLSPAERLAFVLHDMFAVPFDEIAPVVGRSTIATRQLASRARRRVAGAEAAPAADRGRQRQIVDAFLAASRGGRFDELLALLDPEVVVRVDGAALAMGASGALGAQAVAKTFSGRAQVAQLALVDGAPGMVWAPNGSVKVVFDFIVVDGRIAAIDMVADPEQLDDMDVKVLTE
ncbi:sigma-70 family RNA polymerase sigma factor [Streptomyces melanogenes]|uniref:Sigma-70 family RNA polymerase sigma factor n=1 Tax=Streptomyces melanogenes TaxID=67326 RepID=A0ABZ1XSS4_9ACTN|nr:sigma-70 family RNA polymerase sigma factor [Streptomyces melanogenes]